MTDNYMVLDLETNIKNTIGNNKGSSHCWENHVVWYGYKYQGGTGTICYRTDKDFRPQTLSTLHYSNVNPLVGHNIKFDLLYLLRDDVYFREKVFPRILIWDTALVEFIISGQEHKFPSLNECAIKYGGTVKPDKVKELWDAGVDTDDIDSDLMTEYLAGDVNNTELVFLKQFEHCQKEGLLPLVWSQMSALKATTMMEHNGMFIDTYLLNEYDRYMAHTLDISRKNIGSILVDILHVKSLGSLSRAECEQIINLDSPQFISKVIFGGECEYIEKVLDGEYKSGAKKGQPKYRNVTKRLELEPKFIIPSFAIGDWKTKKNGIYKVDEEVLKTVIATTSDVTLHTFVTALLKIRELTKEVGTYIKGITNLVYEDSCIHGNLQHTVAVTGRLTSSNPNLQNITCHED